MVTHMRYVRDDAPTDFPRLVRRFGNHRGYIFREATRADCDGASGERHEENSLGRVRGDSVILRYRLAPSSRMSDIPYQRLEHEVGEHRDHAARE